MSPEVAVSGESHQTVGVPPGGSGGVTMALREAFDEYRFDSNTSPSPVSRYPES
jgi:hypothetical protein